MMIFIILYIIGGCISSFLFGLLVGDVRKNFFGLLICVIFWPAFLLILPYLLLSNLGVKYDKKRKK